MSLTSTSRTAMDTADIIITADTVQEPGELGMNVFFNR
jgi:hypothetical protein